MRSRPYRTPVPASLHPSSGFRNSDKPQLIDAYGFGHLVSDVLDDAGVEGAWRYERIDGGGHWMMLEQPERISALLIDFLT